MLYTIVPYEQIFGEEYDPHLVEVVRGQMRLLVTPDSSGQARIERVISSNPNDYLLAEFQPGEKIQLLGSDLEYVREEAEES